MTAVWEPLQAVFLDRDGVLNVHIPNGYVMSLDALELLPGVAQAVRRLNDAGIPVILISNQQGVGKGLMTQGDLDAVSIALAGKLDAEAGAHLTKSYYCTHLKEEDCVCRKPNAGMLLQAASDLNLDLRRTAFIGDSPTDIQAGAAANVGRRVLVLSGAWKEHAKNKHPDVPDDESPPWAVLSKWLRETFPVQPDIICLNLPDAVNRLEVNGRLALPRNTDNKESSP
jgi:histidinol-phosphate phosphatase family protein